jgi:hypothetical protein
MRWSRSGAAAAILTTARFVWGCSGSPGEGPVAAPAAMDSAGTESAPTEPGTNDSAANAPAPTGTTPDDSAPTESGAPISAADSAAGVSSPFAAGQDADRPIYHVPVPAELEPYSNFELGDLRLREHGSEWELEYTLPELLVGGRQELSFRGSADAGTYQLTGDAGQVTCHRLGAMIQCDEVLSRVELDRDKLGRSFASLPAEESAARWAVADHFSDDPIGVLRFPAQAQ